MFSVIVMLFGLNAWIRDVVNFHFGPKIFPGFLYFQGDFQNRELLGELVVYTTFSPGCRMKAGEFNAADGIPNIQKSSSLAALSIHGQRLADGRLYAKTIQNGAKHLVVIQTIDQGFV